MLERVKERGRLRYRSHYRLIVGDRLLEIDATCHLKGGAPEARLGFGLELESLDFDWQAAIATARSLVNRTVSIEGIGARLKLSKVELEFADPEHPSGTASFAATLERPIPFPRDLDDPAFVQALFTAAKCSTGGPIQADAIETTDRYWIFPVRNIGANGVIVERATGHAFETSGSLPREMWIWGYERQLLDEPTRDLIVDEVRDRERAFAALRKFARVRRDTLEMVPITLVGCATWLAIMPLHEAGDALAWHVAAGHE